MNRLVAVAVGLVILLAGCGTSDDPMALLVEGDEMSFEAPDETSAGDYDVRFKNNGLVAHELAIKDPSGEVAVRRSIGAGQQVVLSVTLTPGRWELACHEPGHYEAGMVRKLLVLDPAR